MVAVVIAAAVTVTMTTDTAEAADHAAVAVMAVEVVDHPLLITEVVHEGTIARGQDLTHLVSYSFFKFSLKNSQLNLSLGSFTIYVDIGEGRMCLPNVYLCELHYIKYPSRVRGQKLPKILSS